MKKIVFLLLSTAFAACGHTPKSGVAAQTALPDGVEVLSFHAKQRCPTCIAIEELTREVIEFHFAEPVANGSLLFRIVEIGKDEALADRYEVTWSSLLICRREDGKETVRDLTQFAFANARTQPEKFKAELRAEIAKLLDR